MTRNPLSAFLRNGQPIPLTCRDFALRSDVTMVGASAALKMLVDTGLVHRNTKWAGVESIYDLTEKGLRRAGVKVSA